jgi:hypothetical protein
MINNLKTLVELLFALRDRRDEARRRKSLAGHVQPAVDRFKLLAKSHGLTLAQVSGLLPRELAIRLSQFKDDAAIAETLTPDFLAWAAESFGVQRAWLEGGTDEVYGTIRSGYKWPDKFVLWLQSQGWLTEETQMHVFTAERKLATAHKPSPMAIAFARPLPVFPDSDARQFLPTGDFWDWGHPPCRASILVLANRVLDCSGIPIGIHRVPLKTVEKLQRRLLVPNPESLPHCRVLPELLECESSFADPDSAFPIR